MILAPDDLLPAGPQRWTREAVGAAWAESRRGLRAALADPSITTVAILVGPPAAGKSSWAREHDQPGLAIFDACWAEPGRRRAVALQIRRAGKAAVAVWIRTPLDVCRDRNAQRPPDRRVPDIALTRAWLSLRDHPPVLAEGWSRVLVQDGQAVRLDALPPEEALERVAMAPARQALALIRGRVLPAYRAARASEAARGRPEPPRRVTAAVEGLGRALARGAAGDTRVGADLGRLGARVERRGRIAWDDRLSAELGHTWASEPQLDLVSDWAERVAEDVQGVRDRVAPGVDALVSEAWRKGWSAADLEAHVLEHGIPLDQGGTAEGQGAVLGQRAVRLLIQGLVVAQQEEVGSDAYVWGPTSSASPDPEHAARRGKTYRRSRPPKDGNPGERPGCNCTAIPVLDRRLLARLQSADRSPGP